MILFGLRIISGNHFIAVCIILVCRKTVDELQNKLDTIDSSKTVEVGQYRLDADGNTLHKKVCLFLSFFLNNINLLFSIL